MDIQLGGRNTVPLGFIAAVRRVGVGALGLCAALLAAASFGQANVLTQHNDLSRTGDNLSETVLTPSNVNSSQFGQLWTATLDDEAYAQPLYQSNLMIAGNPHNVVFDATVNNSVYAFDAGTGAILWQVNLTPDGARPPETTDYDALGACRGEMVNFADDIGITSTPVIDPSTDTLYVVARTIENGQWIQRLHALSTMTGDEQTGSPVVITATSKGVSFDPILDLQRPALTLVNGVVYIGWASHCDWGNYHGWILGYNASTLAQVAAWPVTDTTTGKGGIWMSGQGFNADASNDLYAMTGNGFWDGTSNFGQSFVKLSSTLDVLDYFTPSTWLAQDAVDSDLGSAGALGLPGTSLLVGGGKEGILYVVNTNNMGHEGSTDHVVQEFQATFPISGLLGLLFGSPVYFTNGSAQYVYLWGDNDHLRAYQFDGTTFNSTAVATSTMTAPESGCGAPGASIGTPGGFLSVSANGTSNAIVWALTPYYGGAGRSTTTGVLRAFAANPNGTKLDELWDSEQIHWRDSFGNYGKFTYPTVANGNVFVSTFGNSLAGTGTLVAYGLIHGLSAQAGNASVVLSWAPTNGATSYIVYRGKASGSETMLTTVTSGTTYTDTGLTNGGTYYYTYASVGASGTSNQSNEQAATPVEVPLDLTAMAGDTTAELSWSPAAGATSYNVYTSVQPGGEGTAPMTNVTSTSLAVSGLTDGTPEYYTVAGVDASGISPQSNEVGVTAKSATATFVGSDATTHGSWKGVYGLDGYNVIDDPGAKRSYYPAYASVVTTGSTTTLWTAASTSPYALQTAVPGGYNRVAGAWYSSGSSFTVNIDITDGKTHPLALYFLDWADQGRIETITIRDAITGGPLDTRTVSDFAAGVYYRWNIAGYITITVTRSKGENCAVSGLFFGGGSGSTAPAAPSSLTATGGVKKVTLVWPAAAHATSYNLYRATATGDEGATPYKVGITSADFTDTSVAVGGTYYYQVMAANSIGGSPASKEAHAVALP